MRCGEDAEVVRLFLPMGASKQAMPSVFPLLLAASLVLAPSMGLAQALSPSTAIEHVRLVDGTGRAAQNDVTVILQGPRIQAIRPGTPPLTALPPGTVVVDAHGETMIPGLINAHGHLAQVDGTRQSSTYYTEPHVLAELRQYEHYGVLDMLALGLNRDLVYQIRTQQQAGNLDGASVFVADRGIGVSGGSPPGPHADDQVYLPKTADEARRNVDEAAARETNYIKVWVDDLYGKAPKMQPAVYAAVIDEAHKHHIPVAAHVYALADAKSLVDAGVDVLAHSVRDQRVDRELITAMKRQGTYYIPTLTVDESAFVFADHPELLNDPFVERASTPAELDKLRSDAHRKSVRDDPQTAQHRKDFAMAKTNLLLMYSAGVRVAFGTDSGANPVRLPGYAEHRELQLMVSAGLTPMQALHCATATNAKLLGIDQQSGTLTPGMKADFLLLERDPLSDIGNTQRILSIWHNGTKGDPWVTPAQEDAAKSTAAVRK